MAEIISDGRLTRFVSSALNLYRTEYHLYSWAAWRGLSVKVVYIGDSCAVGSYCVFSDPCVTS